MTTVNANRARRFSLLLSSVCVLFLLGVSQITTIHAAPRRPKPDANPSREAFLQVYKVFTSPRCPNCHPPGHPPLQGVDSHVHLQNPKRANAALADAGIRCNTSP